MLRELAVRLRASSLVVAVLTLLLARDAFAFEFAVPSTELTLTVNPPEGASLCVIDPETPNPEGACDGIDVAAMKAKYSAMPKADPLGLIAFRVGANVLTVHAGWQPFDTAQRILSHDEIEQVAGGMREKLRESGTIASAEIKPIKDLEVVEIAVTSRDAPRALMRAFTIPARGGMVSVAFNASDESARAELDALVDATMSSLTIGRGVMRRPAQTSDLAYRIERWGMALVICGGLAALIIHFGRRLSRGA